MKIGGIDIPCKYVCKRCIQKLEDRKAKFLKGSIVWTLYDDNGNRMHCDLCDADENELIECIIN
jgi:hypothetical protein